MLPVKETKVLTQFIRPLSSKQVSCLFPQTGPRLLIYLILAAVLRIRGTKDEIFKTKTKNNAGFTLFMYNKVPEKLLRKLIIPLNYSQILKYLDAHLYLSN